MTPEELRAARRAVGLTQAELARRFGCARYTIQRWEYGQQPIARDAALRLLEVLSESHEATLAWQQQVRTAIGRFVRQPA